MAICGAKKRNGEACQKSPIKGKKRCRLHGGNAGAPKQNTNSVKHNIYSQFMTEEERAFIQDIDLTKIDDELMLCKVQLKRALEGRAKQEADAKQALDLDSIVMGDSTPDGEDAGDRITYKRRDYDFIIDKTIARISNLTKQRFDLVSHSLDTKLKKLELGKKESENKDDEDNVVQINIVRVGKDGN